MITFLDENDVEYGALATIKATNAVNGERSITGEITSGDAVLSRIERGWRLRFEDEYYVVTYAKPIDEGKNVQVSFDAVHQFFWDFGKSSVYDQLSDGSHTFRAYLDFIFKNSGYSYTVDSALNVYAFEKQSFGFKKRLTLFNDIITSTGVEFQVNGKVVRILEKVGTDLSTVVRKNFNMNELTIEKNIGDFVTYQKGYGAYFDEEDHSKGRLEVEYTSPLASVYGKLEAEPLVDERYAQSGSLLAVLKKNVDNSYTISVSLDMEDLTRAGYKYKQPIAGDYIMAINETLDFQEKIRIVSFTSEYDVQGILVKHEVTCNDIGTVKKLSASYNLTKKQAASASDTASNAYSIANTALVSADGKNTNYYRDSFPVDNPKGTLKKGDLLFLTVGDTVKQYYWNGADWVINPVIDDVEAFKEQIAEDLKDVPKREEFENKIAEELANSKAEIETQIETAKTQAESNAKEYADTINQETTKVAEQAKTAADEIKAELVNVKNNLTETSLVANNAQAAVDAAKQDLAEVASDLSTAKQDLTSHAQQLQTQANAQTELTKRVSSVEETANGTKTSVSELTKTVDGNTKNITSVTARTKVVEDDLSGTKTTLSQVKMTADSTSQKTAALETGLNGVKADLTATTTTANTTKTNLANYQATNDRAVANLQSSMQTANGDISSLKTKVEAVPGQITSAVSAVEGKIPTSSGGRNLAQGTSKDWSKPFTGFSGIENTCPNLYRVTTDGLVVGDTFKTRIILKYTDIRPASGKTAEIWLQGAGNVTGWNSGAYPSGGGGRRSISGSGEIVFELTDKIIANHLKNSYWDLSFRTDWIASGSLQWKLAKAERGMFFTDWSPAPEDAANQISSLSSEIKQTADGITLLATKTELNSAKNELQSGITTATNQISALNTGLSAKVSQSDFNTLSGRVTTAENNIIAKANELSSKITSVESKIPTSSGGRNLAQGTSKDWSKPFTGFSGIENTCPNLYRVTTDGLVVGDTFKTRIILKYTDIRPASGKTAEIWLQGAGNVTGWNSGAYPSGGGGRRSISGSGEFVFELTDKITADHLKNSFWDLSFRTDWIASGSLQWKLAKAERGMFFTDWSPAPEDAANQISSLSSEIKQTTDAIKASVTSLDKSTVKSSSLTINSDGIVMKAGKSTTDVANAIGSYFAVNQNAINLFSDKINVKGSMIVSGAITSDKIASKQINTAHLNGKIITADVISSNAVTTDAIRAGAVTTDKMSANSINGDRIVAGTLDAAKIKTGSITASQIASGTITSAQIKTGTISAANIAAGAITGDKIAANSINSSKIVSSGITANVIKGGTLQSTNGSTNFELNTGKLFYNNNNTGVFRVQNGASTMGLKFSNTSLTVNGTSRILSRIILGGDRRESTLDDGKWDKGGFSGLVIETIKGVEPATNEHADALRAISDTIYFTHTYSADSPTGVSAHGWKMETYAPNSSYSGNIVLKPYGINYRQSDIVVGDIRLDNGDGSGYWMRATINTLKACFGHILNGGTSSQALNAIRSELNKISGI